MKRVLILLALSVAGPGCAAFGGPEKKPPAAQPAPPPAAHTQVKSDWDQRIGAVKVESHSARIGAASIDTLAMGGPASAPKIADYLADPDAAVRAKAVKVLVGFGKQAEPGLARVHELSRDLKPETRGAACQVLALVAHPASRPFLERAAKDRHPLVRAWGLAGLARLGDDCPDRLEEVAELLEPAGRQAAQVAEALGACGCRSAEAAEKLAGQLDDDDEWVRAAAARALGSLGEAARAQVPPLAARLEDGAVRVRLAVLAALAQLGPVAAAAAERLGRTLEDQAPRIRQLAATALGKLGPAAQPQLERLRRLFNDPVDTVAAAARRAVEQITSGK